MFLKAGHEDLVHDVRVHVIVKDWAQLSLGAQYHDPPCLCGTTAGPTLHNGFWALYLKIAPLVLSAT
jgi:hypothetical protein